MQLLKNEIDCFLSLSVCISKRKERHVSGFVYIFDQLIEIQMIGKLIIRFLSSRLATVLRSDYIKCQLVLCLLSSFSNEIFGISCQHHPCCVRYSFNDQHNECVAETHLE